MLRFSLNLGVVIRACQADDLPNLEWYGLFTPHRELIEDAFARQLRRENLMLVADMRGFPVGQVWIDLAQKESEETGIIWALRVIPFLQGLGIGTRLMNAAEEALGTLGFSAVELGVEKSEAETCAFYERLGYEQIGTLDEEYSYTTPSGKFITIVIDQWVYRKLLGPRTEHE